MSSWSGSWASVWWSALAVPKRKFSGNFMMALLVGFRCKGGEWCYLGILRDWPRRMMVPLRPLAFWMLETEQP